jgi:DNA-binding MarR family transcriptional regulator
VGELVSGAADVEPGLRALLRAFGRLEAACRSDLEIGSNELLVLGLVSEGMHAPSELSRAIGMTTAGMTNLLDRMQEDGFIRRERHERDGRRVIVTLTKRGLQSQEHFSRCLEDLAELLDGDDAARVVVTFLARAVDLVDERAREVAGVG